MIPTKAMVILLATLFATCLAESTTSTYASGPLPNNRLQKTGRSTKLTLRMGPSPTPCAVCCRQQRRLDRMQVNLAEEQADLERACAAVSIATTALTTARAALAENNDEISSAKRRLGRVMRQMSNLQGVLAGGSVSRGRRERITAQLTSLRQESRALRQTIPGLRRDRRALTVAVEDAGAELQDSRQGKTDEQAMVDRAMRRRDRAQRRVDACVASRTAA